MDKCDVCNMRVLSHSYHLKCSACGQLTHIRCLPFVEKDDELYTKRNNCDWLCICCTKRIFPFNHYDDDDEYLAALSDNWPISFDFASSDLRNKIFVPFDLNDEAPSPLEEIDPDVNYYTEFENTCFKTCDYYFEESFNKKYQDLAISGESFSLLHVNARSIPCNLSNIESYIDNLVTTFSIIAVTETWLKENNKNRYAIENYNVEHNVRSTKSGGGVALFVRNGIDYHVRNDLTVMNESLET